MQFFSKDAAVDWCEETGIALNGDGLPTLTDPGFVQGRFAVPKESARMLWFSKVIESALGPWTSCMLWVTDWNIWSSSENWHLYYRFRESYSDHDLIEKSPIHFALSHEAVDLISFIYLGLNFGWDMHLFTREHRSHVFISHDEWALFSFREASDLTKLKQQLPS